MLLSRPPSEDAWLRHFLCMEASDHTQDRAPGACSLQSPRAGLIRSNAHARPYGVRAVPPCPMGFCRSLSISPHSPPGPRLPKPGACCNAGFFRMLRWGQAGPGPV